MQEVNITEEELKQMLDNETWIAPQEALEKGFITTIVNEKDTEEVSQSVKKSLMKIILNSTNDDEDDNDDENKNNDDDTTEDNEEDEEPKNNYIGSFFNAIKNL